MTHSSHSSRERLVYGYAYEVALSGLIMDEKEYLANLDPSDPLFEAKFTPRFALLTSLETYRRDILMGESHLSEDERGELSRLVWGRMASNEDGVQL